MPTIKTRVQNKHDTLANWNKATTFRPLPGELIVFEPDTTYAYPRFKVGEKSDNTTNKLLNDLPFVPTGDVRADGDNTFTGMTNTFTNQVNLQGLVRIGKGNSITALSSTSTSLINVKLPSKKGTLALTDDIDVTAAGNNTFTGTNTYYGDYVALAAFYPTVQVDSGILKVGQVTSNNDANHTPTGTFASSTDYGNGGITYRPNTTTHITYLLPSQAGTLALTKDITTVVANPTASGTTTLTKLTVGNTTYNIPSGGSGDVTAAGNNTFTGKNTFTNLVIPNTSINIVGEDVGLYFTTTENQEGTILCASTDNIEHYLYLPASDGTLATQEWTRALFTYSNNTLTINI